MDADGNLDIKDFTIDWKPRRFKIDADMFEAHAILPVPTLAKLAGLAGGLQGLNPEQMVERLLEVFDVILRTDSATQFRARVAGEGDLPPLDLQQQILPIIYWLLEQYGLRPTQPSSDSSTGQPNTGASSTDGAPPTESTPAPALTGADSPPTESST